MVYQIVALLNPRAIFAKIIAKTGDFGFEESCFFAFNS
jgi:hypothetical protein